MKLGFLTAIMADKTFEEVVDYASEQGFSCIEVACLNILLEVTQIRDLGCDMA